MIASLRWRVLVAAGAVLYLTSRTAHAQTPQFGSRIDCGVVACRLLTEASGLAASRKNTAVLWTHNDSGDDSRLFALDTHGRHLGTFRLAGVTARDWEDLALGPGPLPGVDYLYIGDLGHTSSSPSLKTIHRVPEPRVRPRPSPLDTTLTGVETITVRYPDGSRDAETLMLDPLTRDLYIVSKQDTIARVYRAAYPQPTSGTLTLEHVATLRLGGVVAGDISPSGDGILIKTYVAIYFWPRQPDQNLWQAFAQPATPVPYILEPQGEAVAWQAQGKGYYTLSESLRGLPVRLYYYPRLEASPRR
ncbi:MAG: hypothetical protein ONB48_14260 [candidate division KSB1 bacterium]|nr:hypothetical protein [candidate division KSB1 bacterium]MDZ7273599.1 hypothetical protein [candidate division KSB1 bacterium]MDZ7286810.1 hypothetical protein [candidate division KSB1 bacterium]MDZ7299833.1 hypothetical protein [candidate division KSB1 bacterium]MDZ7307746.1 hypothetical protein [candidate division KSB1 bacterium]